MKPQWSRIFIGENVTLLCRNSPSNISFKWTHNGTVSPVTTSSWNIVNASFEDSGEYTCQHKNFRESKTVYLEVFSDWLLLQASAEAIEGKPLLLRCHGWKDRNVYKVTYYKNGQALKYWYENHNISIPSVTTQDSGTYHCSGILWKLPYTSEPLNITVIKAPQSKYYQLQYFIPLLVVILFAADTWLFISTQRQFTFLLKIKKIKEEKTKNF
ncbi:PREDICTED: high affinity immunoglobulin epsilon receptor subunit alpha [Propithecus coquereli]|uniref:high affinity immunoglobulin epsilon receptor subunit alpha n=1 Tax=Propithecus coquereli TaxID=379532 RepID=UPI00063ED39B|nr:PREDICTED: high affinity immunoglobulin epsilon receptor subunit alpha [Propithecus coquereli]